MKILVVCQYYDPEPFRITDICEALASAGHQVTVVTGTPNYPEGEIYPGYEGGQRRDECKNGVTIHRCPIAPRKKGMLHRMRNYFSFPLSAGRYLRRCKEDFDVVFVNQLSPVMMAKPALDWAGRHGKKCVLYCLDLWPESLLIGGIRRESPVYKVFWHLSRAIYKNVDTLLVSSGGFVPYFREVLKLDVEPRWLPQYAEDLFVPPASAASKDTVDFLFAGNVGVAQSVPTIIQAARLLAEDSRIHIHIVGGGVALEECQSAAEGLSNITFYGRKPLEEMPGFYAMADVFLITLFADESMDRNFPGKVQSYMAAGKPIVGSVNGETARIIREADCGICAPAEDPEGLAAAICAMVDDPRRRESCAENALRYYRTHFTKEQFLTVLTDVLQQNCTQSRTDG